jgi:hypothetical protein
MAGTLPKQLNWIFCDVFEMISFDGNDMIAMLVGNWTVRIIHRPAKDSCLVFLLA